MGGKNELKGRGEEMMMNREISSIYYVSGKWKGDGKRKRKFLKA